MSSDDRQPTDVDAQSKEGEGQPKEEKEEIVILVHGTFAASDEDEGDAWWQVGSPFWEKLNYRLINSNVRVTKEPFHWSGANRESERYYAAVKLCEQLRILEERRQPFHLIAHSHGGNVVSSALKLFTKQVTCLQSWTTVGTPFIHLGGHSWRQHLLPCIMPVLRIGVVAVVLFIPIMLALLALRRGVWVVATIEDFTWFAYFVLFLVSSIPAIAAAAFLASAKEIAKYFRTFRAFRDFSISRRGEQVWLGIRSSEDEAISLLTNSLGPSIPIVQPKRLDMPVTIGFDRSYDLEQKTWTRAMKSSWGGLNTFKVLIEWFSPMRGTLRGLAARCYNRIIVPRADAFVWNAIVRYLHGNDHPSSTHVTDVAGSPFVNKHSATLPTLPETIDRSLIESANDRARQIVPRFRSVLGGSALGGLELSGVVKSKGNDLDSRAMVHCSYFDDPDVCELLALHIEAHAGENPCGVEGLKTDRQDLKDWLLEFRRAVARCTEEEQTKDGAAVDS